MNSKGSSQPWPRQREPSFDPEYDGKPPSPRASFSHLRWLMSSPLSRSVRESRRPRREQAGQAQEGHGRPCVTLAHGYDRAERQVRCVQLSRGRAGTSFSAGAQLTEPCMCAGSSTTCLRSSRGQQTSCCHPPSSRRSTSPSPSGSSRLPSPSRTP